MFSTITTPAEKRLVVLTLALLPLGFLAFRPWTRVKPSSAARGAVVVVVVVVVVV